MSANFDWGDDIIDSRDVIARLEEFQDEFDLLESALEDAKDEYDQHKTSKSSTDELPLSEEEKFEETLEELQEAIDEAQEALDQFNQSFDKDELDTLVEANNDADHAPDWIHGTPLILERYFTDYIKDLIGDCYEEPKGLDSWPWNNMTMDWEAAAEEAKADYFDVEVEGYTYFIRG
jgi:hypothetical protein